MRKIIGGALLLLPLLTLPTSAVRAEILLTAPQRTTDAIADEASDVQEEIAAFPAAREPDDAAPAAKEPDDDAAPAAKGPDDDAAPAGSEPHDDILVTEESAITPPAARDSVAASPAAKPAPHDPRFAISGSFRWLFGKGILEAPAAVKREDTLLKTRRLRLFPSVDFDDGWSLHAMLEDMRFDREPGGPPHHQSDRHLYLSRLYLEHRGANSTKLSAGRFKIIVNDGNVFDHRVDGIGCSFGDMRTTGRTTVFYGRTTADEARERKRGAILSYEKAWGKWRGGFHYFDLHSEESSSRLPRALRTPLVVANAIDGQRVGDLCAAYRFDRHRSLSLEWLHGRAESDLDGWRQTADGFAAILRLRQPPNIEKPGDHDFAIAYYQQPRAVFVHHTMSADPTFFGRAGFCGWGARASVVLTRGIVFLIEGFDLKALDETASLGRVTYHGARERAVATRLTAYF